MGGTALRGARASHIASGRDDAHETEAAREPAPVPVLIFRSLEAEAPIELSIAGDVAEWELPSYSGRRLRALLAATQAHAKESTAD